MKQVLPVFLMSVMCLPFACSIQARAGSATSFQLQQMEERYQRLAARVEDLQLVQASLQQTVRELTTEVRTLRSEVSRLSGDGVSREELGELSEEIGAIDRKRQKDRDEISAKLEEIHRLLDRRAPTPPPDPPTERKPERREDGYYYIIKEGDTLSAVVEAYRGAGVKGLTVEAVLEANPGLKPRSMRVGQEVFLPQP